MTELMDATPDYVRFNDGKLSTEFRYLRKQRLPTSFQLAAGPTWDAVFTGSGAGAVFDRFWWLAPPVGTGTISFSMSGSGPRTATVTGVGTQFLSELAVGRRVAVASHQNGYYVSSIATNTSCVLRVNFNSGSVSVSGSAFKVVHWEAPESFRYTANVGPFESVEK
ncbi:MAG: hypothetical protein K2X00_10980 [Nitrospiraceae bacterium]|nr:hypothetical protein [Nitrospiraceae bacterium]